VWLVLLLLLLALVVFEICLLAESLDNSFGIFLSVLFSIDSVALKTKLNFIN
jgi:hypothetical protein